MDQNSYIDLISQHLTNELSEKDRDVLFAWLSEDPANKSLMEEMEKLWEITGEDDASFEVDPDLAWELIDPKLATNGSNSRTFHLPYGSRWFKFAAAIALILAVSLWLFNPLGETNNQWVEIFSLENESKTVQLPDGSTITLNENTNIRYESNFYPRTLHLSGEAFFEVEKNLESPFQVLGENAKTTVLGTSFNVRAYPGDEKVEVTVVSGKVAFEAEQKIEEKEILLAGDAAFLKKDALLVERVLTKDNNAISWKTNSLNFDNTTLPEIINSLERHFNIEVIVDNEAMLACHFSGKFNQPKLAETLNIISLAINGEFEEVNGSYILKGSGCEIEDQLK